MCEQLSLRNVKAFFPRIRVQPVNARARKVRPYFPGYVFGYVDLEQVGRSFLDWIPGAIGIVKFGGEPAPISDHIINTLERHLAAVNAAGGKLAEAFHPGDVVTIQGGVFAGYEGIFDCSLPGRDRVEVLLKMLHGYQLRLQIPAEQITRRKAASSFD